MAQRVVEEGLSVRQTEAAVKQIIRYMDEGEPEPKSKRADPYQIYREAAAKDLSHRFGRKVSIIQGAKKGKIELEYYDDNDLNALLDLLEQVKATGGKGGAKA